MASMVQHVTCIALAFVLTSSVSSGEEIARSSPTPAAAQGSHAISAPMLADSGRRFRSDLHHGCTAHVRISRRLLASLFHRSVNRRSPVHDTILDTHVRGTSDTSGDIRLRLVSDRRRAVFDVVFTGASTSHNSGTSEWVTTRSVTHTSLEARTRVIFDGRAFRVMPTKANARSRIHVANVAAQPQGLFRRLTPKRMVVRQASREIGATHQQREQIVAGRAVARLQSYLDTEIRRKVATIPTPTQLAGAANLGSLLNEEVRASTTADALFLSVGSVRHDDITMGPLPLADGKLNADVVVCLHESAVHQLGHHFLAGATLDRRGLAQDGRRWLHSSQMPDKVRLTLDPKQPLTIRFADGLVDFTLKSKHCQFMEKALPGFTLKLRCQFSPVHDGLRAKLVGAPLVTPLAPKEWSVAALLLPRLVQSALAQQLADNTLRAAFSLRDTALRPVGVKSERGWMMLALSTSSPTSSAAPKPAVLADSD